MSSKFKLRRLLPLQILAYGVVRAASAIVCMLPPRMARRMGVLAGRLVHAIHPRRRVAARQIAEAEGMPKEPREIARIVRGMYESMGLMAAEVLLLPRLIKNGELLRQTRLENFELFARMLERRRGVVCVIGHQMNWEFGGVAVTLSGYPLNSVARPIENPWIDDFINRFRTLAGQKIISKREPIREMTDVLRRNEILTLLADQDAKSDGVFVPFFGRAASTVKGPALLALRHRAPIVLAEIWRDADGMHRVRLDGPIEPEEFGTGRGAVARLTAAYTQRLEQFIRRHPDQWMWLHQRWKSKPRSERSPSPEEAGLRASAE